MHPKPDLWLPAEYNDFKLILKHWRRRPVRLSHRSICLWELAPLQPGLTPAVLAHCPGHFLEEQHQRISV
jgi:hypothetical protein